MESPDCCFRCGKLGHHRQGCTARVSKSEEYLISRLCKRVHKEAVGTISNANRNTSDPVSFPIAELERALETSLSFYFEMMSETESLGLPGIHLQKIDELKSLHHNINMKLLKHRETDKDLLFYCKKRTTGEFNSEDQQLDFGSKVEYFSQLRHGTYELSNKLTLWCVNAYASAVVFWNVEKKIQSWLVSTTFNLGRPTVKNIENIKENCIKYKGLLGIMARESRNLRNICKQSEVTIIMKTLKRLQIRIDSIKDRNLKSEIQLKIELLNSEREIFKEQLENEHEQKFQEMSKKLACTLCEDGDKEWTLPCGHMYCSSCLSRLEEDRTADSIPWINEETGEARIFQVSIPKECAFCKGSLDGKIKLYF